MAAIDLYAEHIDTLLFGGECVEIDGETEEDNSLNPKNSIKVVNPYIAPPSRPDLVRQIQRQRKFGKLWKN